MKSNAPRDQPLGHADEADGIEEYDNALPDWWLGLFWFTIIWAVAYTLHYHVIADRSQEKALAQELDSAAQRWPQSAHAAAFVPTSELAAVGAEIYQTSCTGCHGAEMQGGIGPTLTDDVWIHGGNPEQVLHTIQEGVPAKGMPTWKQILGEDKTRQVAAYVLLKGK